MNPHYHQNTRIGYEEKNKKGRDAISSNFLDFALPLSNRHLLLKLENRLQDCGIDKVIDELPLIHS